MALTTSLKTQVRGRAVGQLNLGTYATGGIAVAPGRVGQAEALTHLRVDPSGGYVFEWDPVNGKVKAFVPAGSGVPMVEVTNATNLSAVNPFFESFGY